MSSGKFASITAGLLARKGEARPWPAVNAGEVPEPVAWRPAAVASPTPRWPTVTADEVPEPVPFRPAVAASPIPLTLTRDKSCALRLSAQDYERLGILAVKRGVTRQQLLKSAVAEFLAAKAAEYGCACLGSCDSSCGNAS